MPPKDLKPQVPGEQPNADAEETTSTASVDATEAGEAATANAEQSSVDVVALAAQNEELKAELQALRAANADTSKHPRQAEIDVKNINRAVMSKDGWVCRHNPADKPRGMV